MKSAIKILAGWAELQIKEITLGVPFKDVQAYEKLHAEQFRNWCKAHSVDCSMALKIFNFKGVTSKKETAIENYEMAANRANQWLSFAFEPTKKQYSNLSIRPVVTVIYEGEEYTEEATEGETPEMWSLYATERKSCLTFCFADIDSEELANEFAGFASEIYGLPLVQ